MTRRGLFAVVMALGLLLVACGGEEPAPETDAGAEETEAPEMEGETVVVTATEYEFDMPDEFPAGPVSFSLVNEGKEPHFLDMFLLVEDAPPLKEFLKLPFKKAKEYFGGPLEHLDTVPPGETSPETLDVELTPGRYVYVCFIETKDGTPHAFLGMAGEFQVQ